MMREVAKEGNGTKSLAGTSEVLVVKNVNRRQLIVGNTSGANKMWLALDEPGATQPSADVKPAAVANTGIQLTSGQTLILTEYTGEVRIIGTAADVVAYVEL